MQSLEDGDDFVRVAYYGDPGSGKTTAVAGAARLGKISVAKAEEGLYAKPLRKLGVPVKNIIPQADCSFDALIAHAGQLRSDLAEDPKSWAAFSLDTVTELASQWVSAEVDRRIQKEMRKISSAEEYTKKPFNTERDDYGVATQQFRRMLRAFADLPAHVAYTAHVRRDVDEDSGTVAYGPSLFPAMQADLMGHVSILIWARVAGEYDDGRPIHIGQTRGTGKYKSKDRLNALPRTLVNPSLDRVVGYVNGDLEEDSDPLQKEFLDWKASQAEEIKKETQSAKA
jgi:hypothetical protein